MGDNIEKVVSLGNLSVFRQEMKKEMSAADEEVLRSAKNYTDAETSKIAEDISAIETDKADKTEVDTAVEDALKRAKGYADEKITDELSDLKAYIGYTDSDIYGLEADFENNKFTRLAGAVGKTPGADFDSIRAFGGRRRCNIANNGIITTNSTTESDGWDSANLRVYQVMVEQPKFYYKVVPLKTEKIDGADGYHLRKARYYISDTPKPGFKVHPAFVKNGVELDKIYLSAYEGSLATNKDTNSYLLDDEQQTDLSSCALSSVVRSNLPASGTTQALTLANAKKLAQNRGSGWGITTIETLSATQLLFIIEYATFNSQAAIGNGIVNATAPVITGGTVSLGSASGVGTNGAVSYRGEENLWGNMWYYVDEITSVNPVVNDQIFPRITVKDVTFASVTINNLYPSAYQFVSSDVDWLFIPSEGRGNDTLPVGDLYFNAYAQSNGNIYCGLNGGRWTAGVSGGLFELGFTIDATRATAYGGARLIYIPPVEEVNA